ncbi:MAG: hypothetical protein M4579_000914 [Chaenotheca gracillima]|nr:MAG: hypothetical protein M4579_000914 [Chaenotheca gracillima]
MSYPPPPGLKASTPTSSSLSPQPPAGLPPRPPPPANKPTSSYNSSFQAGAPGAGGYKPGNDGAFAAFKPRSVGAASQQGWRPPAPTVSAPPRPPSGFPSQVSYSGDGYSPQPYQQSQQSQYYPQQTQDSYAGSPPQIQNPFPLPGQAPRSEAGRGRGGKFQDASVDPEMEAQIAQWQSAYAGRDVGDLSGKGVGRGGGRFGGTGMEGAGSASGANAGPVGNRLDGGTSTPAPTATSAADADSGATTTTIGPDGKQKTVVRSGGGQTWQDSTLLEWDPAHFRLFVGNLAGEVTDESLLKAFARYPSVQKARVVRDKRTTKSKGYGFVSFSDGEEYFQAGREMQGKYIGSHPILLRRSMTEIRPVTQQDKKGGKGGKGGKNGGHGGGGGDKTGAGVQKKSNKTKGGLRVIG